MHYYQVLLKALMLFCETSTCQEGGPCMAGAPRTEDQSLSFSKFVMQLKWQSPIRSFSQIWLHTRYERRKKKIQNPSIFLAMDWNSS
jgi:hypothetical protein